MKGFWFKFQYFLLSLWVLFVLQIILTIDLGSLLHPGSWNNLIQANWVPITCFVLVLIDWVIWIQLRKKMNRTQNHPLEIVSIEEKSPDYLVFFTTIIMPLIAIKIIDARTAVTMILLIAVLFLIMVRTHHIVANPTLAVLGFHLYKIEHASQKTSTPTLLISKFVLKKGDFVTWVSLDENLIAGVKKTNGKNS